jgi:hypothetical protein
MIRNQNGILERIIGTTSKTTQLQEEFIDLFYKQSDTIGELFKIVQDQPNGNKEIRNESFFYG